MLRSASSACRRALRLGAISPPPAGASSCSSHARGWAAQTRGGATGGTRAGAQSSSSRASSSSSGASTSSSHAAVEDFVVDIHPWGSLPLQIAVAAGVASFWRGAWYVMDGTVFPDDLTASGIASLAAGAGGLAAVQRVAAPAVLRHALKHEMPPPPVARYALLCGMAASCVAVWRGTWILWDAGYEAATGDVATDSPTTSGLASLGVAASALAGAGYLSSVLAPPAVCFLLDDEALRRRDCTVKAGTEEARREFLRGATWLFGQTAKRVPK